MRPSVPSARQRIGRFYRLRFSGAGVAFFVTKQPLSGCRQPARPLPCGSLKPLFRSQTSAQARSLSRRQPACRHLQSVSPFWIRTFWASSPSFFGNFLERGACLKFGRFFRAALKLDTAAITTILTNTLQYCGSTNFSNDVCTNSVSLLYRRPAQHFSWGPPIGKQRTQTTLHAFYSPARTTTEYRSLLEVLALPCYLFDGTPAACYAAAGPQEGCRCVRPRGCWLCNLASQRAAPSH